VYLWFEDVWDRGHLPLAVCFLAFIVTFATTRVITRLIRTGRGPFKNNVSTSGVHVHHAVPGVFLMVVGAFAALAVDLHSPWSIIAGLFVGIGTALVLDEFALILHLDDVYWSDKGRVSFEIVMLAVACLGLMLIGANPLGFLDEDAEPVSVISVLITLGLHAAFLVACLLKGKYRMALIGIFLPPVALIGAIRLAKPGSWWARRWYSPKRLRRTQARSAKYAARWGSMMKSAGDALAGKPTSPEVSDGTGESRAGASP
jgi:hypothetical protein